MTRRRRRVWPAVSASLLALGTPLTAQTEGTLGLAATRVDYEGFLSTAAFVVAPAVSFRGGQLTLGGQGSWTAFQSGRGVLQGTVSAAWLAGSSNRWRLELSGNAGASKYSDFQATGHLLAGGRFHLFATNSGGWVGIHSGVSSGGPGGVPVEISAAGWSVRRRLTLIGTATTTVEGAVRSLDLSGGLRWAGTRVELEAHAGARRTSEGSYGGLTEGYGEAAAIVPVTRRVAFWLGGGKYPSDPVRHTIGATYLSAGLRLHTTRRANSGATLPSVDVLRDRMTPPVEGGPPLEVAGAEERRTLRVRVTDASAVEVMADFTDWLPVALVRVAPGIWEGTVTAPSGIHRVNVRVNGGPWMAPRGARQERTEFGGMVGILVVP